jgi:hypothetical protein
LYAFLFPKPEKGNPQKTIFLNFKFEELYGIFLYFCKSFYKWKPTKGEISMAGSIGQLKTKY